MAESFIAPHVQVDSNPGGRPMQRADIEFYGVDMSGPSFEARVFLNNPNAGIDTPLDSAHGYAGSFHVYGLGISKAKAQAQPVTRVLTATDAIRKAVEGSKDISVSVVPVYYGSPTRSAVDALHIENISIKTS